MSQYYNPRRTRNLYDPAAKEPFRVSRSRIDLFLNCPRCFYIDRRLGVDRPPGFPFSLNSAVDTLLKREFDTHRAQGWPQGNAGNCAKRTRTHCAARRPWTAVRLRGRRGQTDDVTTHSEKVT